MFLLLFAAAVAARRRRKVRQGGSLDFQDLVRLMEETEEEDTEAANWKALVQLLDWSAGESEEDRNLALAKHVVEENEKEENLE